MRDNVLVACVLVGAGGCLADGAVSDSPADGGSEVSYANFDAACATSRSKANHAPVDLVFMIEKSSSMDRDTKWYALMPALEKFFADPKSAGLWASLSFFCGSAPTRDQCADEITRLTTPTVPLGPLPNLQPYKDALAQQTFCPGAQIKPAIEAALAYGNTVAQPGHKVATVVVTDGNGGTVCGGANLAEAMVQTIASTRPTYVISVGLSRNPDQLAAAGGTQSAVHINQSNAAVAEKDFHDALSKIRGQLAACNYTIPAPPQGEALDLNNVNVVVKTGGQEKYLPRDPGCAQQNGWDYDSPTNPTQLHLCTSSCQAVEATADAEVEVFFGCATIIS